MIHTQKATLAQLVLTL